MAKLKQCKASGCEEMFVQRNMQHTTHNYLCATAYAQEVTAKRKAKAKRRTVKEYNQTDVSWLKAEAQKRFNAYIRKRDEGNGCISCGNTDRQMHAGHFKSQGGNGNLRFNEDNCHMQCSICNNHLSGNLIPYKENLIKKIGQERVDALDKKVVKSYSVLELQGIIALYKQKIKF